MKKKQKIIYFFCVLQVSIEETMKSRGIVLLACLIQVSCIQRLAVCCE